jgi:HK97 family phage major capsid protein
LTGSKPKFLEINMKLNKITVLVYATAELLEDVNALEGYIYRVAASEIDFQLTDSVLNGNGAGRPLGIHQANCAVTVAEESGQSDATIVPENLVKIWARLWPGSARNAVWIMNQDCLPQLYLMASDSDKSNPVYMPAKGMAVSPHGTLLGRPVLIAEQQPSIGDAGDVLLADLSMYYAIDRVAVKAASSLHIEFLTDQSVCKFTYRFDGQPALASAITPFKSSDTLSPCIRLGARTT